MTLPAGCQSVNIWTGLTILPGPNLSYIPPGLAAYPLNELCSGAGALKGTIATALGNPLGSIRVLVGPYTLTTDANGHWGVGGLPPGPVQVLRLDTPPGCGGSGPLFGAVLPLITVAVNETVTCSGF